MQPTTDELTKTPSPTEIRAQLSSILKSKAFIDSPRMAEFLQFVVNETLDGKAGRIKGFTIAQEVFGRSDPEDANTSTIVRVEARRLRSKLSHYYSIEQPGGGIFIDIPVGTYVPNFEYQQSDTDEPHLSGKKSETRSTPSITSHKNIISRKVPFIAAMTLLLAWVAWSVFSPSVDMSGQSEQAQNLSSGSHSFRPSIAVMPFENMMVDRPKGGPLVYGLTEDIITDLSKLTEVDVVALSSVTAIGADTDLAAISKILNVSHVLRGSVRGDLGKARITAQLFDAKTNTQVWANRYDREVNNLLETEDELAVIIAKSLSNSLDSRIIKKTSYEWRNPAASAMFTQALHLVNPPVNKARLIASRNEFERIVDLEPEFAGGYAGLAYTSAFMAYWRHDDFWPQYVEEAFEYANKAIALDDSFGLSYSALAFAHLSNGEFDEALTISNVGVIKNPNDPYGNAYHGLVLAVNGQAQKGVGYIQRALFLDPLNPRTPFLNILGFVQILTGEPEIALESMIRSLARGGPVSSSNSIHRIIALVSLNRIDEADKLIKGLQDISGFGLKNWAGWIERTVRYQEDRDKLFNPLKAVGLI